MTLAKLTLVVLGLAVAAYFATAAANQALDVRDRLVSQTSNALNYN